MTKTFQIIYLNGPSSSGKTMLAKALQYAFTKPFLHVGIDRSLNGCLKKSMIGQEERLRLDLVGKRKNPCAANRYTARSPSRKWRCYCN